MRRLILAVPALAVAACSTGGDPAGTPPAATSTVGVEVPEPVPTSSVPASSVPASSVADPVPPSAGDAVLPEGFDLVRATVTTEEGVECDLCLWLAETGDQRSRGLMQVTDLGPADGMAFVYPTARTGNFWMKNTILPLSIAFFGPTGRYLSAFDMEPCEADPCPLYRTAPDFLIAIETVRGGLDELGIAPGSTIRIGDIPCGP